MAERNQRWKRPSVLKKFLKSKRRKGSEGDRGFSLLQPSSDCMLKEDHSTDHIADDDSVFHDDDLGRFGALNII